MQNDSTAPRTAARSTYGLTAEQWHAADQVDPAKEQRRAEDAQAMNQGMTMLSYLLSGVIVYGGLGWIGDHFLHTNFLLPVGIILGTGLAIFMIIRRVAAGEAEQSARSGAVATAESASGAHDATSRDREDR